MKKTIILGLASVFMATSCADDIEKYNVDPKNPVAVDPANLFSNGQYNLSRQIVNISYNANASRLWANYATQTTYIQESNYDAANRDIGGAMWDNIYTETLNELKAAKVALRAQETPSADVPIKNNKLAMIKILEVFSYQYLVDSFGDVPFTEALNVQDVTPAYDDSEFIYNAIADSLSNAISLININATSFGTADLMFGGNMAKWKKFAHSLQLKIGTRLSDYDSAKSATMINAAVNGGVFESNADNVVFNFTGVQPYINPVYDYFYVQNRNTDFVATTFFLDILNNLNDPRVDIYYDDNIEGGMIGGVYGASGNAYSELTHFNPDWTEDNVYPATIMEYSTVQFELAEAAARGVISGNAEDYYNEGIKASFLSLGLTEAQADAYIAATPYDASNYLESIGIQKYISLFHNGHEAWTEARRTGFPQLAVAESSGRANANRMIYPTDERLINGENNSAAISNMGGPDNIETKIFWDVN